MANEHEGQVGKVVQVIGAVVDIAFKDDQELPAIYNAIHVKDENGNVIETTVQRVGFREISKADINEAGTRKCRCHLLNKTGKEA